MEDLKDKGNLSDISLNMERLVLYQNILTDSVISKVRKLITFQEGNLRREKIFFKICGELIDKARRDNLQGNLWQNYLLKLVAEDENALSRACANNGINGIGESLYQIALHDIKIIKDLFHLDFSEIRINASCDIITILNNYRNEGDALSTPVPDFYGQYFSQLLLSFKSFNSAEKLVYGLAEFYRNVGYGITGRFSSFRWEPGKGLVGIKYPDPVSIDDLIGYGRQKEIIIQNTEAFVRGKKANNVLLYGEQGTGKSSTVKSLVNKYFPEGLRLVEVPKNQLPCFLDIVRTLREQPQSFLIFIDDLSFEGPETEYKYLKYIIEGGTEVVPNNVLIYATSNRRHFVQETWADRESKGEIRISDSIAEKLSLSDRFGITITFASPDQEEYLAIVEGLAEKSGIEMPRAELHERALQWARWYNGRSGRTARQFINSLLGGMNSW